MSLSAVELYQRQHGITDQKTERETDESGRRMGGRYGRVDVSGAAEVPASRSLRHPNHHLDHQLDRIRILRLDRLDHDRHVLPRTHHLYPRLLLQCSQSDPQLRMLGHLTRLLSQRPYCFQCAYLIFLIVNFIQIFVWKGNEQDEKRIRKLNFMLACVPFEIIITAAIIMIVFRIMKHAHENR